MTNGKREFGVIGSDKGEKIFWFMLYEQIQKTSIQTAERFSPEEKGETLKGGAPPTEPISPSSSSSFHSIEGTEIDAYESDDDDYVKVIPYTFLLLQKSD